MSTALEHVLTTSHRLPLSRMTATGSIENLSPDDFRSVLVRIATYQSWTGAASPYLLAANGFIYRNIADEAQCVHCHIVIKDWRSYHNPMVEHGRHSPVCNSPVVGMVLLAILEELIAGQHSFMGISSEDDEKDTNVDVSKIDEAKLCKVCYSREMCSVLMPCLHLLCCHQCASKLNNCSMCRQPIDRAKTIRVKWAPQAGEAAEDSKAGDASLCKICHVNEMSAVYLPCKHLVSCADCATTTRNCSTCHEPVEQTTKVFVSF